MTLKLKRSDKYKGFIRSQSNQNHQGNNGKNTLHFAVEHNRYDLVESILKKGIAVDSKDDFGNTALWRAVMDNVDIRIIKELLDYHANPDIKNNFGISARDLLNDENKNWRILKQLFDEIN